MVCTFGTANMDPQEIKPTTDLQDCITPCKEIDCSVFDYKIPGDESSFFCRFYSEIPEQRRDDTFRYCTNKQSSSIRPISNFLVA